MTTETLERVELNLIALEPGHPSIMLNDAVMDTVTTRARGRIGAPQISRHALAGNRTYMLWTGVRMFREACSNPSIETIDCAVIDIPDGQNAEILRLTELYTSGLFDPITIGEQFHQFRERHGMAQQELARQSGITAGTIHHYESLVKDLAPSLQREVSAGNLKFKVARAIADIESLALQERVAELFLDGTYSSVYVEAIVNAVRGQLASDEDSGALDVRSIADRTAKAVNSAPNPTPAVPVPATEQRQVQKPDDPLDPDQVRHRILELAGQLDALQLQAMPEFKRLRLVTGLRILDARVKTAIAGLSGAQARRGSGA